MTFPALLFGFLLATVYGALFHLWRGGGAGRLLMDMTLAWVGFWVGNYIATLIGIPLFKIGPLLLGPATLGSLILLFAGHWLSLSPNKKDG